MKPRLTTMPSTAAAWEEKIFLEAVYFTAVRFEGQGRYYRKEAKTFPEILAVVELFGPGSDELLIYAVNARNNSVHLPRGDWPKYLKLWNEKTAQGGKP